MASKSKEPDIEEQLFFESHSPLFFRALQPLFISHKSKLLDALARDGLDSDEVLVVEQMLTCPLDAAPLDAHASEIECPIG
jgi:hypothetical protein